MGKTVQRTSSFLRPLHHHHRPNITELSVADLGSGIGRANSFNSVSDDDSSIVISVDSDAEEDRVSQDSSRSANHPLKSVLLRLLLAGAFIAFGIGALVFSVVQSEEKQEEEKLKPTVGPLTVQPFVSQVSSGIYLEERYLNSTSDDYPDQPPDTIVRRYQTIWLQDDESQRVRLEIGGDFRGPHWRLTVIAFNDSLFELRPSLRAVNGRIRCCRHPSHNYRTFVRSFGDSRMTFDNTSALQQHIDVGPVRVFRGSAGRFRLDGVLSSAETVMASRYESLEGAHL